ncbi:tetratricopeptide repeat protein [Micromonospora sp. NPDC000207]|uniref:tetratricopeptide repeat protein n=1 Tax=Micromonospora sp. NPDC000207 TaxID=3154246 RepID=UPI0033165D74
MTGRLGALLRRHRTAAGLTQEELADLAGVAVRTVRNLELNRVARPQRRTVVELADRLGLSEPDRSHLLAVARGGGDVDDPDGPPAGSLPGDLADFAGRADELARLGEQAELAGRNGTGRVVVVSGPPGVGKTSLVVHSAYEQAGRFPRGPLFVDLRGMDDEPTTLAQALDQLLTTLGVAQPPSSTDARLTQYRALTADRRGLLVLDNARDETQVRPLLPSGPGWLVLVSSRSVLAGLAGAHRLPLRVLSDAEAHTLLTEAVGVGRIDDESAAAVELGRLCGRLPLALRVAANRLAVRPEWSVQALVDRLRDEQRRLDLLRAGDIEVRSAFELSYRLLDGPTRRAFRMLGAVCLPQYSAPVVAALTGEPVGVTEDRLDALADAGLLTAATTAGRYVLHDLLALFAAERFTGEESTSDQGAARDRLARHLLGRLAQAEGWLDPTCAEPPPGFPTATSALSWLDTDRPGWWWAIRYAAARGCHRRVMAAAGQLYWYSDRRHLAVPWAELFGLAVRAAQAVGDPVAEATHRNSRGWALHLVDGRVDEAYAEYRTALALGEAAGDLRTVGWSRCYLAGLVRCRSDPGSPEQAAEHLRAGRDLLAEAGDKLGWIVASYSLSDQLRSLGRFDEALNLVTEAYAGWSTALPDRLSSRPLRGWMRVRLGVLQADLGRFDDAEGTLTEAIDDFVTGDDPNATGRVYLSLAEVLLRRGDPGRARSMLDRATEILAAAHDVSSTQHAQRVRTILDEQVS